MKIQHSLIFVTLALATQGCASAPRVLTVKSFPADAEVCLKGKAGSHHFQQSKECIGSTPLELEAVTVADEAGKKRTVHFKDLDPEKDQFYLVVSRPGYAPQSMSVPGWEHFVTLQPEQLKTEVAPAATPVVTRGSAKITSDPVGALVYVNDFLKGNTPYTLEGEGGQTVRLKIEQAGYEPIERSVTLESTKSMEINLTMKRDTEKVAALKSNDRGFPIEQINK